jgi:hypothetical protein
MLAFVVGNTNFNFNHTGKKKDINDLGKLKMLEIATKEKMVKILNFNPDSCYDFSQTGEDDEESFNLGDSPRQTTQQKGKFGGLYHRMRTSMLLEKQGNVGRHILRYKKHIKWLDIFASILIIAGCILAQEENENYYYDNFADRTGVVKLIKELRDKRGDISKVNLAEFNISYLQDSNRKLNFTDYENLPIPLKISDYCGALRFAMCIMTLASIPLIVVGRYFEFVREYTYIQKFESKKIII